MKTVFFVQSSNWPSNVDELNGALRAAKSFGWNLRVVNFRGGSNASAVHAFLDEFGKLREFWSPLGVIVDSGGAPTAFSRLDFDLPSVFLDRHPSTLSGKSVCVYSDSAAIARLAARELLALDARSYAYAPFFRRLRWNVDRGREYALALKLNGIGCRTFPASGKVSENEYPEAVAKWLAAVAKPVAVFAANDYIGEMVVAAARRNGLRVPDDVAVLGVDNDEEICLRATPSLSSIRPDHEQAGYLAATLLRDLLRNPRKPPESRSFGPLAVFHRSSTRTLRRHDERIARIVEIVRKQALSELSVGQIARDFGVSRRLVELHFREATGHSIRDEVRRMRIDNAKAMLMHSGARLAKIASASGYPSFHAFRKAFAAATGLSPTKWRKSQSPPEKRRNTPPQRE